MTGFATPSSPVQAAIAMQRGIRDQCSDSDVPIRLRIAINAGQPIAEQDDLHGASVVIAKRLESAAPTNGILISDGVKPRLVG
jgi:adenylate cyclase